MAGRITADDIEKAVRRLRNGEPSGLTVADVERYIQERQETEKKLNEIAEAVWKTAE